MEVKEKNRLFHLCKPVHVAKSTITIVMDDTIYDFLRDFIIGAFRVFGRGLISTSDPENHQSGWDQNTLFKLKYKKFRIYMIGVPD